MVGRLGLVLLGALVAAIIIVAAGACLVEESNWSRGYSGFGGRRRKGG